MMKLECSIKIGVYVFNYVVDLTSSTGIDQLTDTCTIDIPRKVSWQGKTIALGEDGIIRTGNRVTVKCGYDGTLQTVFKGYLKHIKPGTRVRLTCENEMYTLKSKVINKSFKSIDLTGLLGEILPSDIVYAAADIQLGQIVISNMSVAKVLEQLRSDFGVYSYFRNDVLYSGFAYWPDIATEHNLRFGHNIIDDSSLEFIREEDVRLKVKAISIQKNNTRIEKEIGDPEGDQRTIFFYGIDAASLKSLAEAELQKLKYSGLKGSVTIFGEPFITKGDVVNITDPEYPERDGKYLVQGVDYKFGTAGYRQKIELGPKV